MVEQGRQLTLDQYLRQTGQAERQALPRVAKKVAQHKSEIDAAIEFIAQTYDLDPEDITGPSRKAEVVEARHMAAYFLVRSTDLSYRAIALGLGRGDHTTTLNSVQRANCIIEQNPQLRETIHSHPLFPKNPA